MRGYESAEGRSRGNLARLEEQITGLRRLNDDLSKQNVVLGGSCEEERSLREKIEQALCSKVNELEVVKAELERAASQARLKEEEVRGLSLRLEKEREIAGEAEELREKVARLESDVSRHKGEIVAMDQGCRATLKRLLKEQVDALYAGYEAKNECMGLKLDHYLEGRAEYDKAKEKLLRAEGALDVMRSLKDKYDVPVPEFRFTEVNAEVDMYKKMAERLVVEDFDSSKLLLELPEEIGAVDVEKMDFRVALQMDFEPALHSAGGDCVDTGKRGEASGSALEGEAEGSQNVGVEEDRDVDIVGRTETSGSEEI